MFLLCMLPLNGFDNEREAAIIVTGLNFLLKLLAYTCYCVMFSFYLFIYLFTFHRSIQFPAGMDKK
jgi:hypothetical protein